MTPDTFLAALEASEKRTLVLLSTGGNLSWFFQNLLKSMLNCEVVSYAIEEHRELDFANVVEVERVGWLLIEPPLSATMDQLTALEADVQLLLPTVAPIWLFYYLQEDDEPVASFEPANGEIFLIEDSPTLILDFMTYLQRKKKKK